MKIVIQRVKKASVTVDNKIISSIEKGLLVLLGIDKGDDEEKAKFLTKKIANLRIFSDNQGKMNLSIKDIEGKVLVVSQFTLSGDCRKGNRPGFDKAEDPIVARELYRKFIDLLKEREIEVLEGSFGANMDIEMINTGPVTFIIEK